MSSWSLALQFDKPESAPKRRGSSAEIAQIADMSGRIWTPPDCNGFGTDRLDCSKRQV